LLASWLPVWLAGLQESSIAFVFRIRRNSALLGSLLVLGILSRYSVDGSLWMGLPTAADSHQSNQEIGQCCWKGPTSTLQWLSSTQIID
jgi:hypothetical protein